MSIQEHIMKNIGMYKYNRKNSSTKNHKNNNKYIL